MLLIPAYVPPDAIHELARAVRPAADRRQPGERAGRRAEGRATARRPRAAGAPARACSATSRRGTARATPRRRGPTSTATRLVRDRRDLPRRGRARRRAAGRTTGRSPRTSRAGASAPWCSTRATVPDRGYFDVADVVVTFEGRVRANTRPPGPAPAWLRELPRERVAVLVYGGVAGPGGRRRRGRGPRRLRLRDPGRPPASLGDGARLHRPRSGPDDRGVHSHESRRRHARSWSGSPGARPTGSSWPGRSPASRSPTAAPPMLVLSGAGRTHRLPRRATTPARRRTAAVGGRVRLGGAPAAFDAAVLQLGGDLAVDLPEPGDDGRRAGSSCPRGLPGASRTRRSPASTGSSSRPTR